ncbi:uncharacterized protein PODANS_4_3450 [Podospora anserina S mat+]|uniref:Podospora anserina S mat+ genomic DNA chromosome 4, supercontig 4 n=1 Tax=Podospora anserina (strain S / ATCC MYA-4624 / DSM 980 / FGSC 10383) TaxID=515849 RepID=B2AQR1_PODAN|nr:uncharacterized protein PODANS_4_3450 [Podospora anserina S mat+]CAP66488.1 unnamed protein product [Podospora anserina S mat+]CDP28217.1 Putative protein of unknown function [Podospora anserina S mat+]
MDTRVKTKFLILSDTDCCKPTKHTIPDLFIAGNHDFTLDPLAFLPKTTSSQGVFQAPAGAATSLLESASSENIIFLDEGTRTLALANGALLTVYASPYSPSRDNSMALTHNRKKGHTFKIPKEVDVVITHSPPRGILGKDSNSKQAGCDCIYDAIATARPKLHCFGHIHEGWGG